VREAVFVSIDALQLAWTYFRQGSLQHSINREPTNCER